MKKLIVIFFLLSINPAMGYENEIDSLGIGLLKITNFHNAKFLTFYSDTALTERFITWDIFNPNKKYFPMYYKPHYGLCSFICLAETEKYYKVLINKSLIKFLPREKNYVFESWEAHLGNSFGVRAKGWSKQKAFAVKIEPNDSSKLFYVSNEVFFCALEMQGEWIKVQVNCVNDYVYCKDATKKCKKSKTGWIRWRNGEKIMLEIATLC